MSTTVTDNQSLDARNGNGSAPIRRGEILRKILHVLPGGLPFLLVNLPHPDPLDKEALVYVSVVTALLTGLYLVSHRFVRRADESDFISTAVSYPATVLAVLVLFPGNIEFTGVVVAVLAFGDASAYVVGKCLGKRCLPWNSDKTWAGTIAFVIVAAPIASLSYWSLARPDVPVGLALLCGVCPAIAGAIAESVPSRITDNLRVGVAAALTVVIVHFAAVDWFLS